MIRLRHVAMVCLAAGLVPAAGIQTAGAQDDSALANLVIEVQQLRDEVRRLHGQLEDQQRELENLKRRQRDQYLDLDKRIQEAASASPPQQPQVVERPESSAGTALPPARDDAGDSTPDPSARPDRPEVRQPIDASAEVTPLAEPRAEAQDLGTPTEEEQTAYDRAFLALREQRYADAAEGFHRFLNEYPNSTYAPNAQYWLGEAYYVTRDFATALDIFQELLDKYPDSSKAGDALLKVGYSHYELEQWTEARAALEQVRSRHSGTTLARLAENRLRDLRMAGHY